MRGATCSSSSHGRFAGTPLPLTPSLFHSRASPETIPKTQLRKKCLSQRSCQRAFPLCVCVWWCGAERTNGSPCGICGAFDVISITPICSANLGGPLAPSFQLLITALLCIPAGVYTQSCDPADHKAAPEQVSRLGVWQGCSPHPDWFRTIIRS